MKRILGRILSAFITASGWLLAGARTVLDLIGYSTAPEDVDVAQTRLDQFLQWLLSVPWWTVWGFALVSTMWLIWVSWPRQQPAIAQKVEAPAGSPAVSDAPQRIPGQDGDTAASHDPALEQMIRMYIIPASARLRRIAIAVRVASEELTGGDFFAYVLDKKSKTMIDFEVSLLHPNSPAEQEAHVLQTIDEYDETTHTIDHVMMLLTSGPQSVDRIKLAYDEWKQKDKEFKRQLTAFSAKRGYEKLYGTLERCNWIVT